MTNTTSDHSEPGYPVLMRRDRIERIANAERDRRAGRIDVAIATIGDPIEWPARAVVCLARMSGEGESEARAILEEGLDAWAADVGVGDLGTAVDSISINAPDEIDDGFAQMQTHLADFEADAAAPPVLSEDSSLDAPLGLAELDRAFEEAETEVESMHDVNDVAERVLMDEPIGFDAIAGDSLALASDPDEPMAGEFAIGPVADVMGLDAAYVEPADARPETVLAPHDLEIGSSSGANHGIANSVGGSDSSRQAMLATLESWLQNIERRRAAGRAQ